LLPRLAWLLLRRLSLDVQVETGERVRHFHLYDSAGEEATTARRRVPRRPKEGRPSDKASMNFALILAILLAVAVGFLFHQLRQVQGDLHDIRLIATSGVTLDELEQTVVPAVESLRVDTEAIRRNMTILAAALCR